MPVTITHSTGTLTWYWECIAVLLGLGSNLDRPASDGENQGFPLAVETTPRRAGSMFPVPTGPTRSGALYIFDFRVRSGLRSGARAGPTRVQVVRPRPALPVTFTNLSPRPCPCYFRHLFGAPGACKALESNTQTEAPSA